MLAKECLTSGSRSKAVHPWMLLVIFDGNELASFVQCPFAFDTSITVNLNCTSGNLKVYVHLAVIRTEKTALEIVFLVLRIARYASCQTGPTPRAGFGQNELNQNNRSIYLKIGSATQSVSEL